MSMPSPNPASTENIDDIIQLYGGWKGQILSDIKAAIAQADPDVSVEIKWRMATRPEGLPVWYRQGIMCLAETFTNDIKLVFTKGALMKNHQHHFNARLKSATDRAIEFHEGDTVDQPLIQVLVAEAIKLNQRASHK